MSSSRDIGSPSRAGSTAGLRIVDNKTPTQRVGIVPDVEVRPTTACLRAGRGEVLEEAVRQILGLGVSDEEILRIVGR